MDLTWSSATDIIWLDYPIYIVLWRLLWRSIARIRSGVELWDKEGCVETWRGTFLSWDSLLYFLSNGSNCSLWVIWFYWKRRPVFHEMLVGKDKAWREGVNVIWFRWPSDTEIWMKKVGLKKDH